MVSISVGCPSLPFEPLRSSDILEAVLSFLAATFAKLREGRTVAVKVGPEVWVDEDSFECKDAGGVCGRGGKLRSVPVRELDLDITIFSKFASRSRSRRSATSFSRELTSTGLQPVNSHWL